MPRGRGYGRRSFGRRRSFSRGRRRGGRFKFRGRRGGPRMGIRGGIRM